MKLSKAQREQIAAKLDQIGILITDAVKCGGPGSGVPGPCPEGGSGGGGGGKPAAAQKPPKQPAKPAKPVVGDSHQDKPPMREKPPKEDAVGAAVRNNNNRKVTDDPVTLTPPPPYKVNVDATGEHGITKAARVGVPGDLVPPKPPLGNLPGLTKTERDAEQAFNKRVNDDPDGMAKQYLEKVLAKAAKSGKPPTFETDEVKELTDEWMHPDPETRLQNRSTLNVALHQAANAVAKRAFLMHLDTLKPGDEVMVTVGGCGSGKSHCLGQNPTALEALGRAKAVWDAAGDQNATENAWIQKELEKPERNLKGTYFHVSANPSKVWAQAGHGVVARAALPTNGRMVDGAVFADSYAIGNRNHAAFHAANKDNPNASFIFVESGKEIKQISEISKENLNLDRKALAAESYEVVSKGEYPDRVKQGGTVGQRIWKGS